MVVVVVVVAGWLLFVTCSFLIVLFLVSDREVLSRDLTGCLCVCVCVCKGMCFLNQGYSIPCFTNGGDY